MKNQANLSILHLLGCGEVGLHGVLVDTQGEEQGDEAPGQIANKAAKNENRECINNFRLIPFHISGWSSVYCSENIF